MMMSRHVNSQRPSTGPATKSWDEAGSALSATKEGREEAEGESVKAVSLSPFPPVFSLIVWEMRRGHCSPFTRVEEVQVQCGPVQSSPVRSCANPREWR